MNLTAILSPCVFAISVEVLCSNSSGLRKQDIEGVPLDNETSPWC